MKFEAQPKQVSCISPDLVEKSLKASNNFLIFLNSLFGTDATESLKERYKIGSSKHWNGATVFWQIDHFGKVRTGKIMQYDATTGKRVKEPYRLIQWVHTALNLKDFSLSQCLFGLHFIAENGSENKPIAIVESEKTAIIASVFLPKYIWMATGGKEGLTAERLQPLAGRKVILFPDLNGFELWKEKAKHLINVSDITVSDYLQKRVSESEVKQGYDLADYLTNLPLYYPKEWSQPLPANNVNDRWRLINSICNLETAINSDDGETVLKQIDRIYSFFPDKETDLPIDLFRQYAPKALSIILN
ncbi:MAG: hypothetical protein IPH58_03415 [Sphingobacteriales bacterium]|nr:hypothetical protein [Sphingobacteriales bacterium]